jgi:hypothetical protein
MYALVDTNWSVGRCVERSNADDRKRGASYGICAYWAGKGGYSSADLAGIFWDDEKRRAEKAHADKEVVEK